MVLADSLHAVTSQCEFHTKQYVVKTIEIRDYAKSNSAGREHEEYHYLEQGQGEQTCSFIPLVLRSIQ